MTSITLTLFILINIIMIMIFYKQKQDHVFLSMMFLICELLLIVIFKTRLMIPTTEKENFYWKIDRTYIDAQLQYPINFIDSYDQLIIEDKIYQVFAVVDDGLIYRELPIESTLVKESSTTMPGVYNKNTNIVFKNIFNEDAIVTTEKQQMLIVPENTKIKKESYDRK